MIITRTPFRISFAGGGSDIYSFYSKHEGCVLSASINKYMFVSIHPSFNREETILKYSRTEIKKDINDLKHPIAKALLEKYHISGVEITSTADIPSGTGLSTSSAYTVGLINALNAFTNQSNSQEVIAEKACNVEIDILNEPIGKQDQYGTALGGFKFIRFLKNGQVIVEKLNIDKNIIKRLEENLLLFYTGITHIASDILKEQSFNIENENQKFTSVVKLTQQAERLRKDLLDGNIDNFGLYLDEGWKIKQNLSKSITSDYLNDIYNLALKSGATGGKLLGAGGGGFMLFYVPKENQNEFRNSFSSLIELPFEFENIGTTIIYNDGMVK